MKSYQIIMQIHPSISSDVDSLQGDFEGGTNLLEGIVSILSKDQKISEVLLNNGEIKPGFLLISNKIELRTTGKIMKPISENMDIRIIPISHGG